MQWYEHLMGILAVIFCIGSIPTAIYAAAMLYGAFVRSLEYPEGKRKRWIH